MKYFLEQCLHSVYKAGRHIAMEIMVVDNNSTDGSATYLEPLFPGVRFYWNKKNTGFAKACNEGLAVAKGDYILFLNPDTILPENCLEDCIAFFESHADAGAVGVRMIDGSGSFLKESKRGFPSPLTAFFKLTGVSHLFPKSAFFSKYYLGQLDEHVTNKVDVLPGAFMAIRKSVLNITGGFDEAFFMYGEDIDLSYRIQQAGYHNYYYPAITIIHFKGESTTKDLRYIWLFYKAMGIFVRKHYSGSRAFIYSIFIQCAIGLRAGVAAVMKMLAGIGSVCKKLLNISARENVLTKWSGTIYMAGTQHEYDGAKQLMMQAGGNKEDMQLIQVYKVGNVADIATEISEFYKKGLLKRIILCEGVLSFAELIQLVETLPTGVEAMMYASESNSIVGSAGKHTNGETIPAV